VVYLVEPVTREAAQLAVRRPAAPDHEACLDDIADAAERRSGTVWAGRERPRMPVWLIQHFPCFKPFLLRVKYPLWLYFLGEYPDPSPGS